MASSSSASSPPPFFSVTNLSPPDFSDPDAPPAGDEAGSQPPRRPWSGLTFNLERGDILLVRGESGCGKTTLLKCLSDLIPYDEGTCRINGHLPTDLGGSTYRSRVLYVPQRPALLAGTPLDFLRTVEGFKANRTYTPLPVAPSAAPTASAFNDVESTQPHGWRIQSLEEAFPEMDMRNSGTSTPRTANANANANASKPSGTSTPTSRSVESSASPAPEQFTTLGLGFPSSSPIPPDAIFLASAYFNLSPAVWERDWIQISGGEAQRASLAVALSLVSRRRAEGVLLLDEPTSALDDLTAQAIEQTLLLSTPPLTLIWITHSDAQAARVARLVAAQAGDGDGDGGRSVRVLKMG